MPTRAVEGDDRMRAQCDLLADFRQMQVHGERVDAGQTQGGPDAARRTDRAEDIGPFVALIARGPGTASFIRPDVGQAALLSDPGFILPPELEGLSTRMLGDDGSDEVSEVFLCASCAAAS
jgi:hypothetical protein